MPLGGLPEPKLPAEIGIVWLLALMAANTVAAVGLFGDIARHVSQGTTLTGTDFLSSWHLVLYGGVAAVAVVLGFYALKFGPLAPVRQLSAATAGLATLTFGGLFDLLWHGVFGVEASFEALVSPPHLTVLGGLFLLMVAPILALNDSSEHVLNLARSVVVAFSIASLLVVISLFTGYLSPLIGGSSFQAGAYFEPIVGTSNLDYDISRGIAMCLWFATLSVLMVCVVRLRLAPVTGTWTAVFGVVGITPVLLSGEKTMAICAGLTTFGLVTDLVTMRKFPNPLLIGLAVMAMWGAWFAVLGGQGLLLWSENLWGGVLFTGLLVGTAVSAALRWLTPISSIPSR